MDDMITEITPGHIIRRYTLHGKLINDYYIYNVEQLTYETNELRYESTKNYDDEGNVTSEFYAISYICSCSLQTVRNRI